VRDIRKRERDIRKRDRDIRKRERDIRKRDRDMRKRDRDMRKRDREQEKRAAPAKRAVSGSATLVVRKEVVDPLDGHKPGPPDRLQSLLNRKIPVTLCFL